MKKLINRLLSLALCISVLLTTLPTQTLAYMVAGEKGPLTITTADGETTTADESWEKTFPYGAFAFEMSNLAVKEGEKGTIKVYRLGGTTGRATAYLTYEPVIVADEGGEPIRDYAISAEDVDILVEEPQPVAQYQPVGKPAAPKAGKAAVKAEPDETGYTLTLDAEADSHQWQALSGGAWTDIQDATGAQVPADAELVDGGEYDYRCRYTQGGVEYVSLSLRGESFSAPEEESLPPMPDGIELNAKAVYTPLDLRGKGEDPYNGWAFELIFAEGEWVKEIHVNALLDELPEAEEAATFTIRDCEGGEVLEAASTLLLRIGDINEPEPSTLGFAVSEITVDKADGTAEVMLERVGGGQRPVSIEYATQDGTALAGKDYAAADGKLMFYGGVNKLPVKVALIDDGIVSEEPVYFEIKLSELLGDDSCTLTEGTVRVSLINSGKGELPNLATQLYDPDAVDLTDAVETAAGAANGGGGAVMGTQVAEETPEEVYAALVSVEPDGDISTQSYSFDANTATIKFSNPANAWSGMIDMAQKDYWKYLGTPPALTNLLGAGETTGKLGSGNTEKINEGVALQSRNEIEAGFSDAALRAMGAGEDVAGQLFSQYYVNIKTDNGHDTSYLGGTTRYHSYTAPRFYLQQDGSNRVANPLRVKRFGNSPFDALWKVKSSDVNSENEDDYRLPFSGDYTGNLSFGGLNAKMSLLYHIEYPGKDHQRDELNDYSMVWLKMLKLFRRNFAKDAFQVEVSTPNDSNTAPDGCAKLEDVDYEKFLPKISIQAGAGGVTEQNRVYVGSTVNITAPDAPKGYKIGAVVVYRRTVGGVWESYDGFTVSVANGSASVKLVGTKSKPLSEAALKMEYKFRVIYARESTVTVDLGPSVPRREGSPTQIDTTKINYLFNKYNGESDHDFISNGASGGGQITYGYNAFDINRGDYTQNIATRSVDKPRPTGESDSVSFSGTNIQWINFNLSPKDLVLVNGEAYPGDAKIYLTKADMVGGLSVYYYHEDYQTALSAMKTNISWMALYWDADGSGMIDGKYNEENGTFTLDADKDEFVGYIDPGSFNETLFAPKKNANKEYCQYFIKTCYTMTPRSLVLPKGANESERAQVLPAFTSALNPESPAYAQQTPEQKAYRYVVSGKTIQSKSGTEPTRSSDDHLKYGAAAGKKSTLDVPLGGDFSPANLANGASAYTWTPMFRGNELYPFAAPTPITIENSIAGPTAVTEDYILQRDADGALAGYSYGPTGLKGMNSYLSSFTGSTTLALVSQEQNYTTDAIFEQMRPGVTLGGGSDMRDDEIYVQSDTPSYFVTPDSITMSGVSTTPDAEYLKQMEDNSKAPETDTNMKDSGSEMPEFNQDLGINLGSMEIAVTDLVTILMDGNKVGFSIGIPLGEVGDEKKNFVDANRENWTQFGDFFKKSNFGGDEDYKKAKTEYNRTHPSAAPSASPAPSGSPAPSASPQPSPNPMDKSQFKSKSFSVGFSVTLAFLFEYNPLDNGYYFEGMTVAVSAELSFRLQGRLTVCPIVYFYLEFSASIEITTGLGVIRKSVEGEKILNAKTAAAQDAAVNLTYITRPGGTGPVITAAQYNTLKDTEKKDYTPRDKNVEDYYYKNTFEDFQKAREVYLESKAYYLNKDQYGILTDEEKAGYRWTENGAYNTSYSNLNKATEAYNEATSYSFETSKKAFNIRFNGMLSVDVLVADGNDWKPADKNDGFITGFLSSDGTGDTQVVLKKQDGMELGKTVKVVLRPLDHNPDVSMDKTTITYIALIKAIRDDVYWKGIELSPSVALELGAGVGVELLKFEIYAKLGLEATFLLGVYNTNYDPDDNDPNNDTKYQPASVESFGFSIGLGLRVVVVFFTFEMDVATFHVDYAKEEGWSTGWSFFNDTVTASEWEGEYGVKIRLPQSTADRQKLYAPEDNLSSDMSTQAYDPTDASVPFQLSGYGSSVDAANLSTDMIPGGDYKLVRAGDRDFVVYTISRNTPAEEDATQLVMSELTRTTAVEGGKTVTKYGFANPSGAAKPLYISLDDETDATGDLEFDVWTQESINGTTTTHTIHAAWVSYADPSTGFTNKKPEGEPYGKMTADNYKDIEKPSEPGEEQDSYQEWYDYYNELSNYNAGAQARLAKAVQENVAVKQAKWSYTSTPSVSKDTPPTVTSEGTFTTPETLRAKGAYAFAPVGNGDMVFFGSTSALDTNDTEYKKYEQYLQDTGSAQQSYAGYLRSVKKSTLDTLGTQSTLNLAYKNSSGTWAVSTEALTAGQTLSNVEFTTLDGDCYVAYTTRAYAYDKETSQKMTDQITAERLFLRKVTVAGDTVTWGDPYLLRMVRDYDQSSKEDGLYKSDDTPLGRFESPYFSNLSFLSAKLDSDTLTGGEAALSTMDVAEHTFLLFEMNGATYILLDDSMKSITGDQHNGTIYPFFTGAIHENEDGTAAKSVSGKLEVTIGADAGGNLYAVYVGAVPNTTNNALYLSAYDAYTKTWGDGVMLAMRNMNTYEASVRNGWGSRTTEAAYLGLAGKGNGLLTGENISALYGDEYMPGIMESLNKASEKDLGDGKNLTFTNLQAARGGDGDLLVLTQGTLTALQVEDYSYGKKSGTTVMPKRTLDGGMDSSLGMYAVSYGRGQQGLGQGSISFSLANFGMGSRLNVGINAVNTGDTAFRGSENQPITATLSAGGQELASWLVKENIRSGQPIFLEGECAPLAADLKEGDKFVLNLTEYTGEDYKGTSVDLTVFTVEADTDLGVEQLKATVEALTGSGASTRLNVSFLATNRGSADAAGAYAQFTYRSGVDEGGNPVYSVLDLTNSNLTVGLQEKLSTLAASTTEDLEKGILRLYNSGDGDELNKGYGRWVSGTIDVPAEVFAAGADKHLELHVEIFSTKDTIQSMDAGVLSAKRDEYNSANNTQTFTVEPMTEYTVASSIVIPMGSTTLIPVSATNTTGGKPALSTEEIDDVVDGKNIGVLNFKQTSATAGSVAGVLSITPTKPGSGVLHISDANTKTITAVTFIVTDSADGIDIYNDNGMFAFVNADGTPYDKEKGGQDWSFLDTDSWGTGSANERPLRNNLAYGKAGASFTFNTVAESIDLYFKGTVKLSSDNIPGFAEKTLTNATGGSISTLISLAGNSDNTARTLKVTVANGDAAFDRLVEHYAGNVVPVPGYDGEAPIFIWSRSFPATGAIKSGDPGVPLTLYVLDNEAVNSLTVNGTSYSQGSAGIVKMDEGGALWQYDMGTITANGRYTISAADTQGNTVSTELIVDWFNNPASGDVTTVKTPEYDAAFRLGTDKWSGTDIGSVDIGKLNITFTEESGNTKKTGNTHQVYQFTGDGFTKMTAQEGGTVFALTNNGIFWTRTVNSDNTWSAKLLSMEKVDKSLPQVNLWYNSELGQLDWKAYKEISTSSNITEVTINGYTVNSQSARNLYGELKVAYNGDYTLTAKDGGGNSVAYKVTVNTMEVDLSKCTAIPTASWNQMKNNGIVEIDLSKGAGVFYHEADSNKAANSYFGRFETTLVPADYDLTQIEGDTALVWKEVNKAGSFKTSYKGVAAGDYLVVVRDPAYHKNTDTIPVTVEDHSLAVSVSTLSDTYGGDGQALAIVTGGNVENFEFAILPIKELEKEKTYTIEEFRALDTPESDKDDIVWLLADDINISRRARTFDKLNAGNYLIAVRGIYGVNTQAMVALETARATLTTAEQELEEGLKPPAGTTPPTAEELEQLKAAVEAAVATYEEKAKVVGDASAAVYAAQSDLWSGAYVVDAVVEATPPGAPPSGIGKLTANENGSAVYKIKYPAVKLTKRDNSTLIGANAKNDLVLTNGGLSVYIPKGTLTDGFDVNRLLIDPASGKDGMLVSYTDSAGKSFVVPWSLVGDGTVAYFVTALGDYKLTTVTADFKDIAGLWGESGIVFAAVRALFSGTGNGNFSPDMPMSRSMFVTVLWRIAGSPAPKDGQSFTDVKGDWYRDAVAWAVENGITQGYGGDLFGSDDPVSREQMCVFLNRFLTYMGMELNAEKKADGFADSGSISGWAADSVAMLTDAGIIMGTDGNAFAPGKNASRMEVGALLTRFITKLVEKYCTK